MTLSSMLAAGQPAPVRSGAGSPTPSCQRESGRMPRGGYTAGRPSPVRSGAECRTCPLRSQCIAAKGRSGTAWCMIHRTRKASCRRHGRCSRAPPTTNIERDAWRWNTGWPDWSSWASASPAISAGSRRGVPAVSGGYSGQPDPGGGQNRAVGQCRRRSGYAHRAVTSVPFISDVQAVSHGS